MHFIFDSTYSHNLWVIKGNNRFGMFALECSTFDLLNPTINWTVNIWMFQRKNVRWSLWLAERIWSCILSMWKVTNWLIWIFPTKCCWNWLTTYQLELVNETITFKRSNPLVGLKVLNGMTSKLCHEIWVTWRLVHIRTY